METLIDLATVFRVAPAFGALLLCAIAIGQVARVRTDDKEARDHVNLAILVLVMFMIIAGFMGLGELSANHEKQPQDKATQSHQKAGN